MRHEQLFTLHFQTIIRLGLFILLEMFIIFAFYIAVWMSQSLLKTIHQLLLLMNNFQQLLSVHLLVIRKIIIFFNLNYQLFNNFIMIRSEERNRRLKTISVVGSPKEHDVTSRIRENNKQYIKQSSLGNYRISKHYLQILDQDISLLPAKSPKYKKAKLMTLSAQAYVSQRQGDLEKALQYINTAQNVQQIEPIDHAKNLLNKSALMSKIGKHQQSMELAKKALNILKTESQKHSRMQNYSQLSEMLVICLFNISVELQFVGKKEEAKNLYKKCLNLSVRTLGIGHQLSQKIKKIVNIDKITKNVSNRLLTKQKQQIPYQSVIINAHKNKLMSFREKTFFKVYKTNNQIKKTVQKRIPSNIQIQLKKIEKMPSLYLQSKVTQDHQLYYQQMNEQLKIL